MAEKTEELFAEIAKNVRADREKLRIVRDKLVTVITGTVPGQIDDEDNQQIGMIDLVENLAKIADVMVKQNNQLIELSKVTSKNDDPEAEDNADKDSLFDEIEEEKKLAGEPAN